MPQRTISAAGGNWNSLATWVEGAVPTTSDFVVGNASSGNLSVNVSTAVIQYFDFTNYNGNITFTSNSNRINFSAVVGTTTIFGSGTTYTYTGGFGSNTGFNKGGNGTGNIRQFGTTNIGVLGISNTGIATLLSDLYVSQLYFSTGSGSFGFNGFSILVDSLINQSGAVGAVGTTNCRLVGTGATTLTMQFGSQPIVIDTTGGTTTISANGFGGANLTHLSGNISNPLINPSPQGALATYTYDLISGTSWNMRNVFNLNITNRTINLIKPTSFNNFQVVANKTSAPFYDLILAGNIYNITNFFITRDTISSGIGNRCPITIQISPTITINVSTLFEADGGSNINQLLYPSYTIKSSVPGTPATFNINTFNQNTNNTVFTDITCAGGNKVYGLNLTLSNTNNIQNITLPTGSGGGETSSVFIS